MTQLQLLLNKYGNCEEKLTFSCEKMSFVNDSYYTESANVYIITYRCEHLGVL